MVEDLTAGLVVVVAAAAAFPAVLMKCFKLVTIEHRLLQQCALDKVPCRLTKE